MKIVNEFDAAREGDWESFIKLYTGDPNRIGKYSTMPLFEYVLVDTKNAEDRLKILRFLLENGADLHMKSKKLQHNALHTLYYSFNKGDAQFVLEASKILVEAGADINERDKYEAIPLRYFLIVCCEDADTKRDIYQFLLKCGSDYKAKDVFGRSCLDYAKIYPWLSDFLRYVFDEEREATT